MTNLEGSDWLCMRTETNRVPVFGRGTTTRNRYSVVDNMIDESRKDRARWWEEAFLFSSIDLLNLSIYRSLSRGSEERIYFWRYYCLCLCFCLYLSLSLVYLFLYLSKSWSISLSIPITRLQTLFLSLSIFLSLSLFLLRSYWPSLAPANIFEVLAYPAEGAR